MGKEGRKAAGVEPTKECLAPPTGFEAQPHHQIRMPSFGTTESQPPLRFEKIVQSAVGAQMVNVALEASIPNPVEKFQNLNRAFASEAGCIAKSGCGQRATLFARKCGDDS